MLLEMSLDSSIKRMKAGTLIPRSRNFLFANMTRLGPPSLPFNRNKQKV
jgi:hypothetical protein